MCGSPSCSPVAAAVRYEHTLCGRKLTTTRGFRLLFVIVLDRKVLAARVYEVAVTYPNRNAQLPGTLYVQWRQERANMRDGGVNQSTLVLDE
jgi:hypothetical protein